MRWVYLILIGGICFSAPLEAKGLKPWSSTQVKVIDGDSIVVGGREVRMEGIDAPEYHQDCYNAEGKAYACGVRATEYMQNLTKGQKLRCEPIEIDRYKRVVAVCFAGKTNLNAEMVRSGNADKTQGNTNAVFGAANLCVRSSGACSINNTPPQAAPATVPVEP